ncbi:hypothetical protein U472_08025 [Orenia metallireducens]|uniref:Uncharacterized protein n=1 Tax=Orenia metallireducens TaxID=1413210 RepID=A0A1C0A6V0_9FIRM|nr:hypothetical protein [Orenia metallireducens]OCL25966.1 hypothetical protein U472_08025 [Orenia metallireducens]
MIKYPEVKESSQRIVTVLSQLYKLGVVDFDYSDSIKLYCEVIPDDKEYLKVKVWLTEQNQLSIYEDINGGLEHRDFVSDMAKYLEIVGELNLGDLKIERWDHKSKEYQLDKGAIENNCFTCYYRTRRGYCNLLKSWHPRKEGNSACAYWIKVKELVI